jgi:hypothetical protein
MPRYSEDHRQDKDLNRENWRSMRDPREDRQTRESREATERGNAERLTRERETYGSRAKELRNNREKQH